ncbi:polysaccharide deacetylase family protein [Microvirga vignae]|uniref:polysaccharide deacetylase family protein n=1 Tax=Microvirga vignae TaxID=1225564 RepID=UPI00069C65F3|nr:polysaccharide deacetylase family protein [Microvirga vignae]
MNPPMINEGIASAPARVPHEWGLKGLPTGHHNDCLRVLCYHRVGNPHSAGFKGFRPAFTATADQFTRQMQLVRRLFTPVSLQQLVLWLQEGKPLPRRPVLVTFDDGYRDNGDVAWPIMREFGIPGVVFVATDHIGTAKPFLWDFAAYCFQMSALERIADPLIGERNLSTMAARHASTADWVAAAKRIPGSERWTAAQALADRLDVSPPENAFAGFYLGWDDVRRLSRDGLEFGGHTCTHPILTQLPTAEAQDEIAGCQARLTEELGRSTLGFAYPNGSRSDYAVEHEEAVRNAGFAIAFTLEPGPLRLQEVRQRPMAVRRIYVGFHDNAPRFIAKLTGMSRLAAWAQGRGSRSDRAGTAYENHDDV